MLELHCYIDNNIKIDDIGKRSSRNIVTIVSAIFDVVDKFFSLRSIYSYVIAASFQSSRMLVIGITKRIADYI